MAAPIELKTTPLYGVFLVLLTPLTAGLIWLMLLTRSKWPRRAYLRQRFTMKLEGPPQS